MGVNDTLEYEARQSLRAGAPHPAGPPLHIMELQLTRGGSLVDGGLRAPHSTLEAESPHDGPEPGGWHRTSRRIPGAWVGATVQGIVFRCVAPGTVLVREATIIRASATGPASKVVVLLPGEAPVAA